MKKNPVPILAAALSLTWLLLASPANAAAEPEAVPAEVSEALHATHVKAKLIDKLGADALRIKVSVSGETATLTGEVAKSPSQGLAEQVALSVEGIKKVDNKVTVKEAAGPIAAASFTVTLLSTFLIPSTDRATCSASPWLGDFATSPVRVAVSPETETLIRRASAPSLSISLALTWVAWSASETSAGTASGSAAAFAGDAKRSHVRERAAARIGTAFFFI